MTQPGYRPQPPHSSLRQADDFDYSEDRDHPLVLRYALRDDYLGPVTELLTREGLNTGQQLKAAAQIIAAAIEAHGSANPHVSYSRDRSHYTSRRRRPYDITGLYTYDRIVPTVSALGRLGLLEHFQQVPGTLSKWQSSFKASDLLLELMGAAPSQRMPLKRRGLIELRDKNGFPVHCPERAEINLKRRHVEDYNRSIASLEIYIPTWFGKRNGDTLSWINAEGKSCSINLRNVEYRRIYNTNMNRGGRWYGHPIQSLPKIARAEILINRESVAEPDYSALHPSILYRMLGINPPADNV